MNLNRKKTFSHSFRWIGVFQFIFFTFRFFIAFTSCRCHTHSLSNWSCVLILSINLNTKQANRKLKREWQNANEVTDIRAHLPIVLFATKINSNAFEFEHLEIKSSAQTSSDHNCYRNSPIKGRKEHLIDAYVRVCWQAHWLHQFRFSLPFTMNNWLDITSIVLIAADMESQVKSRLNNVSLISHSSFCLFLDLIFFSSFFGHFRIDTQCPTAREPTHIVNMSVLFVDRLKAHQSNWISDAHLIFDLFDENA